MTQFVQCKFRPTDGRAYTYANDGEPVKVGDEVKVPDKAGDGWQRVTVTAIDLDKPTFACKPVLGLAPPRNQALDEKLANAPARTAERTGTLI